MNALVPIVFLNFSAYNICRYLAAELVTLSLAKKSMICKRLDRIFYCSLGRRVEMRSLRPSYESGIPS